MSSANHPILDPAALSLLACPACHGELRPAENRVVCTLCERSYPVAAGIPILIPNRAQST
ncbi:MAG: hypothetical protein P4L03_07615 [Terracidiphilus sp.]|nr:hypothetical protein [Terracidiphilus sp.]